MLRLASDIPRPDNLPSCSLGGDPPPSPQPDCRRVMTDEASNAPVMSGLGNFKGVMLCNRPMDAGMAGQKGGGDGPAPFKSMVSATQCDQLGLPPCKGEEDIVHRGVKKRGPSAALRQHMRWLRELQDQMRGDRQKTEEEEKTHEERQQRIREEVAKLREGVREMMFERDAKAKDAADAKAHIAKAQNIKAAKPPVVKQVKTKRPIAKPLWAMTEQEKIDFEEGEGENLINFAENLNFDQFVGDLEFRNGLETLGNRAKALMKEQDAFKEALVQEFNGQIDDDEPSTSCGSPRSSLKLDDGIDGQSLLSELKSETSAASRKSRGEERYGGSQPDWDRSTSCGEPERLKVSEDVKEAAAAVLDSAPQIKAIHSKESVQRIIEKEKIKRGGDAQTALEEAMAQDGGFPVPVITRSEDTTQLLHKPPDPSNLPYLYRSPAI